MLARRTGCLLTLCLAVLLHGPADAASPEPGDPTYHALRYDDDYNRLGADDPLSRLKNAPIGDAIWLNLGGELRERVESYTNPNFGIKAPASNAYLLHRLLLNADLHVTDYARAFVQVGQMERLGNRGLTSATDIDRFDVMQAFVDLKPPSPLDDHPLLRVGREELLFGFQRLIAVREGPNVRRDFDGIRFNDHWGEATIDVFTVRPVSDGQGVFDDRTNEAQLLWGAYLTVPLGSLTRADVYQLNYQNNLAKYRGQAGVERRQTYGVRLFGETDGFDWNGELALQQGTFRNHDIRAAMAAGIVGYTARDLPMRPRIGLETNAASGDNSRSSAIGTFNGLFPRLPYFAETSLLVPANVIDVRPVVSFVPVPDVTATFGWDSLWRASGTDGLYGNGMVLYPGTNKVSAARIGSELSADVRWRVDPHLLVGAIAARFLAGPAIQQAVGKTVGFYVMFATYRF